MAPPRLSLRSRRARGLTATELLISCSLVALLLTFCLAGVSRLSSQTKATQCLANLRQLSSIFLRYTAENNGLLVPAVILLPPAYTSGHTWMVHLDQRGYLPRESYDGKMNAIMTCPARSGPGSYTYNQTHYGVNRNVGFDNIARQGVPFHKISRIRNLSQTMLLGESEGDYMLQSHSDVFLEYDNRAKRKIAFPHQETANIIFMDGHAERSRGPWKIPKKGDSYPFYGE